MRKFLIALLALCGFAAIVAVAQARDNEYTVEASTTPRASGSSSNPRPVGINFNYTIDEVGADERPSPVKTYNIAFTGLRVNSNSFRGCTAAQINSGGGDRDCPNGSLIGTGLIIANIGPESDPSNLGSQCFIPIRVYNSRRNRAAIYLNTSLGRPAGTPSNLQPCPDQNAAIPANFVRFSRGVALRFNVPEVPFRQQLGSVEITVRRVQSRIRRLVRNGRGFFEAVGRCRSGIRDVTVTFLDEENVTSRASARARCS